MFKLNQKGQQFSVFELMIAGIVAFAILMLLLTIIMKVDITNTGDAKSAIENGIASALPSSTVTTKNFTMKSGDEVTAEDLTNKTGLDASRIYFVSGQMKETDVTIDNEGDAGGALVNARSGELKVRAKIICKATGASVAASLARLDDYTVDEFSADSCEENNQSCCVVVLEKPGN